MGAAGRPGLDGPLQVDRKQACPAIPAPATHCPPYVHLSFPQEPVTSPCMLPPGPTPGCMTTVGCESPGWGSYFWGLGSRVLDRPGHTHLGTTGQALYPSSCSPLSAGLTPGPGQDPTAWLGGQRSGSLFFLQLCGGQDGVGGFPLSPLTWGGPDPVPPCAQDRHNNVPSPPHPRRPGRSGGEGFP